MTLREKLKIRLSLLLWRFRHGRAQRASEVVWPPQSARPQTVIIFLPENFEHFDIARRIVDDVRQKLDPLVFLICLRENYASWMQSAPNVRQIPFGDAQKNWLGLPRAKFIQKLRECDPDMAIDLSPSYSPFQAYSAVMCGARLRLSLDYPEAGLFHNLLISPDREKPLSERYQTLVSYL